MGFDFSSFLLVFGRKKLICIKTVRLKFFFIYHCFLPHHHHLDSPLTPPLPPAHHHLHSTFLGYIFFVLVDAPSHILFNKSISHFSFALCVGDYFQSFGALELNKRYRRNSLLLQSSFEASGILNYRQSQYSHRIYPPTQVYRYSFSDLSTWTTVRTVFNLFC